MLEFLLCLFGGWLGLHKFYRRQWILGILYLCTVGLFFIGWIYDTIRLGIIIAKGETPEPIDYEAIEKRKQERIAKRKEKKLAKQQAKEERERQRELAIQAEAERMRQLDEQGIAYCPRCKSTSIQYVERRKQLSISRAIVGSMINPLAGAVGAVTSKKYKGFIKCLKCGYSWKI